MDKNEFKVSINFEVVLVLSALVVILQPLLNNGLLNVVVWMFNIALGFFLLITLLGTFLLLKFGSIKGVRRTKQGLTQAIRYHIILLASMVVFYLYDKGIMFGCAVGITLVSMMMLFYTLDNKKISENTD